ncbi:hypothetical protein Tco_0230820 [Tanacetum coccineum]
MLRRKKILASSKPKASKIVRESPSTPQVVDIRHAEETMATIDTTQSLEASESMGDVKFEDLFINDAESPFDTESKIKMVKRFQPPPMDDEDQITFLGPIYDDMETTKTQNLPYYQNLNFV